MLLDTTGTIYIYIYIYICIVLLTRNQQKVSHRQVCVYLHACTCNSLYIIIYVCMYVCVCVCVCVCFMFYVYGHREKPMHMYEFCPTIIVMGKQFKRQCFVLDATGILLANWSDKACCLYHVCTRTYALRSLYQQLANNLLNLSNCTLQNYMNLAKKTYNTDIYRQTCLFLFSTPYFQLRLTTLTYSTGTTLHQCYRVFPEIIIISQS